MTILGGTMTELVRPCPLCGNELNQPVVCTGCEARGERDLRDLPRLATVLLGIARDPSRRAGEPVTGSRERPLPLQAGIWSFVGLAPPGTVTTTDPIDARCQVGSAPLADTLHTTCRAVADDLGIGVPKVRRNTDADQAVGAFVRMLLAQHTLTCRLPWADEYLTELHDLWSHARTLAQDWPLVHKLPAPCPYCWTLTLRRDNGARFVYCDQRHGGCDRRWTEDDYERLVLILVTDAKEAGWLTTTTTARTGT
jgi:hypothetical protein